jgi:hypothetical protein
MVKEDEGRIPACPKFWVILRQIEVYPYRYPKQASGSPDYLGPGPLIIDSEALI